MSGFLTRRLLTTLILCGLALPAVAQNSVETPAPNRDASFLPAGSPTPDKTDFSGLATAPPQLIVPPSAMGDGAPMAAPPSTPAVPTASVAPIGPAVPAATLSAPQQSASPLAIQPVVVTTLPNVSPEAIGVQSAEGLGADMWKGTPRSLAEYLLSAALPTSSSTLNLLMRRLLSTAATPPEGESASPQALTSLRVEKMTSFGNAAGAWALATHADPKLVDDITFHLAAETALTDNGEDPCTTAQAFISSRTGTDWQKFLITCQLRAKDSKSAQVGLDVLRTQSNRDPVFIEIADKDLLSDGKKLPFRLTPLNAPTLALLRLTNLPLPAELYNHTDTALIPGLLHATPQQDIAQLALAERAAQRGMITTSDLATIYRNTSFTSDELGAPLTASESGLRLQALLFRAAEGEKDQQKRIAYAVRFVQNASPAFLNGAGAVAASMLGDIPPDPALAANAVTVARIYMMANKGEAALGWIRLAQTYPANAEELQALWPQFVLAGLEPASAYESDIGKWVDAALRQGAPQVDTGAAHDTVMTTLLLLDAAGLKTPDTIWAKALQAPRNEKRFAFSPSFMDRLQSAGAAGKRAETILLSIALVGDSEISLPEAVTITRALRLAGFKSEAAIFARQTVALLAKTN